MFDPQGLVERYRALEGWEGDWVNYWTETAAAVGAKEREGDGKEQEGEEAKAVKNDEAKDKKKHKSKQTNPPRHFIVLPSTSGLSLVGFLPSSSSSPSSSSNLKPKAKPKPTPTRSQSLSVRLSPTTSHNWELVRIPGAEDEVQAHCGLFIRQLNTEYELFVQRVAGRVGEWVRVRVREGRV